MAHYCPYCQFIYPATRPNCPFCGGKVLSDSRTEAELRAEGYVHKEVSRPQNAGKRASPPQEIHIEDDDILSKLKQGDDDAIARLKNRFQEQHGRRTGGAAEQTQQQESVAGAEENFFDQFDGVRAGSEQTDLPAGGHTAQQQDDEDQIYRAREQHCAQAHHPRQTYNPGILGERLRYLPWGTILRGALILCIILFLAWLWSMRGAIAAALWDFVMALLPSVVMIAIIIAIIRSLFRR